MGYRDYLYPYPYPYPYPGYYIYCVIILFAVKMQKGPAKSRQNLAGPFFAVTSDRSQVSGRTANFSVQMNLLRRFSILKGIIKQRG
jgi:hypothetical protein